MKPGDQVRLKTDVHRAAEIFRKGDKLTLKNIVRRDDNLRSPANRDGSYLWAVEKTNVGFWENELELLSNVVSLIDRDAFGNEKIIVSKGSRVIVKIGEYQGIIGTVEEWDDGGILTIRTNNLPFFYVSHENIKIWTEKDDDINFKFQKLFGVMTLNKTSLELRKKENFIKSLIDKHIDNVKQVRFLHDRFLYHEKFSKKDIRVLNKIWKIENESAVFYINPKWVYDKSLPHGYKSKYTEIEYRNLMSFQPNTHAVMYGSTT